MNNKVCKKCKTERPINEFYKSAACKDGHRGICRFCLVNLRTKTERLERNGTRVEKLALTVRQREVVRYGIAVVEALDTMRYADEDVRHLVTSGAYL